MKKGSRIILLLLLSLPSCLIIKEDRQVKKATKEWRQSPIVLEAYADSPLSGLFLKLRDNGKFEFETSGLVRSYEAGEWKRLDTSVFLSYNNAQGKITKNQTFVLDRNSSTMKTLERDSLQQLSMRIMVNKIWDK